MRNLILLGLSIFLWHATSAQNNVGIGVTDPQTKLEVGGSNTSNYIRVSSINTVPNGIEFVRAGTAGDWRWQNSNGFFDLYNVTNDFAFATPDDIVVTFTNTGRLGIGNISPEVELDVSGTIRSSTLVGSGNRRVFANANGDLVIPTPETKYYSASAFGFNSDHPEFVLATTAYISDAGTSVDQPFIYSEVNLPDGAIITAVQINFWDDDSSNDITVRFGRRDLDTLFSGSIIASYTSSGSPGTSVTVTEIPFPGINDIVDNELYAYVIDVQPKTFDVWTPNIRIRSIRIAYNEPD